MDSTAVSASIAKFAAKFCNELPKDKSVVSSPLSAEFVLALIALGAEGPVHDELLTSLGIPDDDAIRSSFSTVSSRLKALKGVTLNVANQVYVKEGPYDLQSKLKNDAVKVFDAGIEKINFVENVKAANTINSWVEKKTNQKIKDLISSDCLGADTRLVLVNALYFKGNWKTQFNPQHTKEQPFHVNNSTTIQVPMMFKEANYKYADSEGLKAQLLEMPYEGEEASMVIILPNEVEGLNDVLQQLANGYDLMGDLSKMHSQKVIVQVPKFKVETEIDLKQVLPKLGISGIFEPNNTGLINFLTTKEPLFVSSAIQKAFIEVNEEGAEAAAATGVVMMLRCAPAPSPRVVCDRPFLYLLSGPDHGVLFTGVYRGQPSFT